MSRIATIATVGLVTVLLVACAGEQGEPTTQPEPPAEEPDEPDDAADEGDDAQPPEDDTDPTDDGQDDDASTALLDAEVQMAIDDAADRTGVARDEVTVVTSELVTWPDGSIGCPDPDQMYTMALVDGYRIVVEAAGDELAYHGAEGSPPAYCPDPQEPA